VTGVDISPDLVAHAQQRATSFPQVTIIEADAAQHAFEPTAHDALFSRHGYMFFADGSAAFRNIRRGLRRGARVALSAFAPLAENPWATVPLAAAESVLGPAPAEARAPPGPFAWAEPSVFRTALGDAGFRAIAWEGSTVSFTIGAGNHPDPVERACAMVLGIGMVARRVMTEGKSAEERVRPALKAALASHVRDGWVRLPARIWLVTASA
jgi:SAM-dependent methyltransferase